MGFQEHMIHSNGLLPAFDSFIFEIVFVVLFHIISIIRNKQHLSAGSCTNNSCVFSNTWQCVWFRVCLETINADAPVCPVDGPCVCALNICQSIATCLISCKKLNTKCMDLELQSVHIYIMLVVMKCQNCANLGL